MFKKPFRSKLYKHSWLEVAEEDTNTSQTWGRIKDSLKEDLADMVLLYKKLPKEKRDQLYTQENFRDVLNLLLEHEKCDDSIKLGIAAFLVEKSLDFFKIEFLKQHHNTIEIANAINDPLDKAKAICKDIVYMQKMKNIKPEFPKEDLRYLASWNELAVREKGELENFLATVMDLVPEKIDLHYSSISNSFHGDFQEFYYKNKFYIHLELNSAKDKAILTVTHEGGFKESIQFTVKSREYDYLLYYGKSEIEKMKSKGIKFD
ncbi:hypothetical protein NMY3_01360 [Candidatus Nitrosocosmicus oleophilus]|jgi:hypothetical protein|uniref:Uncharacterized protein n=1 Tax=Candidatus Nitrosocosmicus oleophilus TaxID=1353260 RepID=A0A654LVS3_9ARCH|nr:hypothetical protein [Candidatus Nitrosocosmicus oleophilus]ALI35564.1 hypothetical protein NMY3_01360 [Candidatus Nitrosocosmicus oleophilus]